MYVKISRKLYRQAAFLIVRQIEELRKGIAYNEMHDGDQEVIDQYKTEKAIWETLLGAMDTEEEAER